MPFDGAQPVTLGAWLGFGVAPSGDEVEGLAQPAAAVRPRLGGAGGAGSGRDAEYGGGDERDGAEQAKCSDDPIPLTTAGEYTDAPGTVKGGGRPGAGLVSGSGVAGVPLTTKAVSLRFEG